MGRFRAAGRLLATAMSVLKAVIARWLGLAVRAWLAQLFLLVQLHEMMRAPDATPAPTAPLGVAGVFRPNVGSIGALAGTRR